MDNRIDYSGNQLGKYILKKKLGNGNFGSVYLATDILLSTDKAIKIMSVNNPEQAEKLFTEASLPYKCRHDNIVEINDGSIQAFNEDEYVFVIDMEYVNGGNLESLIENNDLSIKDSLTIIKNILFGLQHSHPT